MAVVHKEKTARGAETKSTRELYPSASSQTTKSHEYSLTRYLGNQNIQNLFTNNISRSKFTNNIPNPNTKQDLGTSLHHKSLHTKPRMQQGNVNLTIQCKSDTRESSDNNSVSGDFINHLGGGQPLNTGLRHYFEPRFGKNLSNVRVHTGQTALEATSKVNALAFTVGNNIVFDKGEYQPDTRRGRHLLAHELAHTIQQRNISGVLQPRLKVSRSEDYAEREADRAADSVLEGNRAPRLTSIQPIIQRREATSIKRSGDDERIVDMDDGQRYRVKRYRVPTSHRRPEYLPADVTPGISYDNVTITIEWCRDTRGNVTLGANIPEQARGLAGEIVGIIRRGGSRSDIEGAFANTDVTPFINFVIARQGEWEIFSGVNITVGGTGVTAGGGRVGVRRGGTRIVLQGQGSKEEARVTLNLELDLPEESRQEPCATRERVTESFNIYYHCELYRPVQREERTRDVERTDRQTHFIYFEHARSIVLGQPGQGGSAVAGRNSPEMVEILSNLTNGYRVTRIVAFTSPEGLRTRQLRGRFRGNDQLARDRAQAALDWINNNCPVSASDPSQCAQSPQITTIPPEESERFSPADIGGQEVTGRPLAEHAVGEFLGKAEEERHRTEALVDQINRARTPEQQARLVYPLLRRAEITLEKTSTVQEPYEHVTPAGYSGTRCPDDVVNAASNHFRNNR